MAVIDDLYQELIKAKRIAENFLVSNEYAELLEQKCKIEEQINNVIGKPDKIRKAITEIALEAHRSGKAVHNPNVTVKRVTRWQWDDEAVIKWLNDNEQTAYIKTKQSPDKTKLKKSQLIGLIDGVQTEEDFTVAIKL